MKLAYVTSLFPFAPEEQFFEPEIRALAREVDVLVVPVRPPSRTSAYPDLGVASLHLPLFSAKVARLALREFARSPRAALAALREVAFGKSSLRSRAVNLMTFPKALAVAREARRLGVDHLHAAWLTTPATLAYVVWRLTGITYSISAHSHDIFAKNLVAEKVRTARFTRVISERNCRRMRRKLPPALAARCVVGHLGVDLPAAPGVAPARQPRIVCIARLHPVKGHVHLLEALRLLRERGYAFTCDLAGDGELRDSLIEMVERLGLTGRVRFLGNVPHAELTAALAKGAYDVAVLASLERPGEREGIPVALMEAMAAGLPVVATRTGSLDELVVPGTGVLVEQADPAALAAGLEPYLVDAAERRAAGERGRAFVRAEFEASETTRRLLQLAGLGPAVPAAVPEHAS
jgi:glycosyltransferase involved in cell wall biosynthesis